jgi:hypothetical protein
LQALFKARFEQALESQKLNIKKIETQLCRKGVNPEDPVAMASIQRVASTFFRAIDEQQGTPYVFRGDTQSVVETAEMKELRDHPSEDSDQEELDRFRDRNCSREAMGRRRGCRERRIFENAVLGKRRLGRAERFQ